MGQSHGKGANGNEAEEAKKYLPQVPKENPSSYPATHGQTPSSTQLEHLEPFRTLKAQISDVGSKKGYPEGELGLLAHTKSEPIHYSFSKAVKPLNETEADRLREIIHHHSEMGIMREETKGLSHPDTLHSFLTVAEAYFHLGQYAKAQPLLEQVFILSDETSRPEFTVQAAEILNFIYRSTDFRSNLRALNKKSLSPPSRRRK